MRAQGSKRAREEPLGARTGGDADVRGGGGWGANVCACVSACVRACVCAQAV